MTISSQPSTAARIGANLMTVALVLSVAFSVLFAVSIVVGIARDGRSLLTDDKLSVPVELSLDSIGPLPTGVGVSGSMPVRVEVVDPTTKQMLLSSALDVGAIVVVLAALWLLRGLARSVTEGEPFGAANVARLRRLGYLLVLGVPAVELLSTQLRKTLWETLPSHADLGVAGFSLPGNALLAGLAAFILAEVFAHGVRLREDVEGTV